MIVGIVGSEGKKFTPETEEEARKIIRTLITHPEVTGVCSGECHLGGIDIYVKEECDTAGVPYVGFPPKVLEWDGGYKERNIQIAEASDHVICITLKKLPAQYVGMRFSHCYHCGTGEHVKSGGCWTVKYAKKLGKKGDVIVIGN